MTKKVIDVVLTIRIPKLRPPQVNPSLYFEIYKAGRAVEIAFDNLARALAQAQLDIERQRNIDAGADS